MVVIITTVKHRMLNFVALIYSFSYKTYSYNSIVNIGRDYFGKNDRKRRV